MKKMNEKIKGFSPEFIATEKRVLLHNILEMDDLLIAKREIMRIIVAIKTDASIDEIARKIQFDNFFANELFRLINFELFISKRPEAKNLMDALLQISEEQLENSVYAASIKYILKKNEQSIFDNSYSTSLLIDKVVREYNMETDINLPIIMLLSNLGSVVLKRNNKKKYEQLQNISTNDNIPIQRCETSILYVNHCDISKILLGKWNISRDFIYLISNHHTENDVEKYKNEIELIQFVNWIDCSSKNIPCYKPKTKWDSEEENIMSLAKKFVEKKQFIHTKETDIKDITNEKTQLMNRNIIKETKKGNDTQVLYLDQLNINFKSAKKELENSIDKIETKGKTQLIDRTILKVETSKELTEKIENLNKTRLMRNVLRDEIKNMK